ncbi:molybdopterin molybdotransferase MoeA [Gilvimarinus algae]|uniref:Molybdopterin molybdenumtransferase n=1 Tax=Gilvimarinus algae TaxID=3058037 RepID=A0ABT8TGF6_9GAMM|nr:gephyrin-like molybdotransferase Glp [Gilvimarinus sp. SDUM040014]MDO3381402.1 molybdopterin molybdotransferase MoeA [Gilvimarinus sp. SDUM040014]
MTNQLLSVEQARQTIIAEGLARRGGVVESVPLEQALGRVLAEDIVSGIDVPPADNSAMDGYAVRAQEALLGVILPVSQTVAAGTLPAPLAVGSAARILTGAELPPGADAVVIQEEVERTGDVIELRAAARPGDNIRPRGQDIARHSRVLSAGHRLRPQDLGLLASINRDRVSVYQPIKVALLSTGSELVEPGAELKPGQIYNSNRPMLAALLSQCGCQVVSQDRVADDAAQTRQMLSRAAEGADLIVTTGGVSVGDEDHVKAAVQALGELSLWKIAMKPGKPLAFGRVGSVPLVGLPGNPVSAYVAFQLLVRPLLQALGGQRVSELEYRQLPAAFHWPRAGRRDEYARARVSDGRVELYPQQSSGALSSVVWAECLVCIPAGASISPGELVQVLPLAQW